jgi:hypothetical protein
MDGVSAATDDLTYSLYLLTNDLHFSNSSIRDYFKYLLGVRHAENTPIAGLKT